MRGESSKSQSPNLKQIPISKIQNLKKNHFGHSELVLGAYLGFVIWNLTFGLKDSNKRKLPSGLAFFAIREKKIATATGAEVDPEDTFLLDPFFLYLIHIDFRKIDHPFPFFFWNGKRGPFRLKDLLLNFIATGADGGP